MTRIGVIADTHGLLRPGALEALRGSDLILHAGDVGSGTLLPALEDIARVIAVRGNVDGGPWADLLPLTEVVEVEGRSLYLLHAEEDLDLDPAAAGFAAVIFGHSHQPVVRYRKGVLYLNPGSAGPRRFDLPVTVASLEVHPDGLRPTLIPIPVE
ncbi:MAG: metallophosphoesterase family protein [Gemmatimonadota bacterium]|nr:metallophosphoesterase family protein [Gemmatimonadota bacterium]